MSNNNVFDQDAPVADAVDVNDTTRVYRDDPFGWAYLCWHPQCTLNANRKQWHALAGFPSRGLAMDAAAQHVEAVRARRQVIA